MSGFTIRTWADISLPALRNNLDIIRSRLSPKTRLMAVVKADAYGHGALPCAREFARGGADFFGVSCIDEAVELRRGGITQPILTFGYTAPEDMAKLCEYTITQTVFSLDYAAAVSEAARRADKDIKIHIKVNTGMNRLGFDYNHIYKNSSSIEQIIRSCKLPRLIPEGIFTHFAESDNPRSAFTKQQFDLFTDAVQKLSDHGLSFEIKHACNSGAFINFPEMHLDMVRCGIILYGLTPDSKTPDIGIIPAMSLKTRVSQIRNITSNQTVSYGRAYRSFKNTKVATLPIGYADGFSRQFSNNAEVMINKHRAPIIGRICMDQCMADITGIPANEGDEVTIFGTKKDGITADELATLMESINYEVVCLIGKRVPRVYIE